MWLVLQGELTMCKLHLKVSSRAGPQAAGSEFPEVDKGALDLDCSAGGGWSLGSLGALEPECLPYWQALVALRRVLLAQFSAFPLNGADLYEELKTSTAILSTGIGRFVRLPEQEGESRASRAETTKGRVGEDIWSCQGT